MNLRIRDLALPIIGLLLLLCAAIAHCQPAQPAPNVYNQVATYFTDGTSAVTTKPAFRVSATESNGRVSTLLILNAAAPLTQTWNVGNGNQWQSVDQLKGQLHSGDTVLLAPGQTTTTTGFNLPANVTIRTAGAPRHTLKLLPPAPGDHPATISMNGSGSKIQNVNLDGPEHENRINYGGSDGEISDVELLGAGEYGINANNGFNGLRVKNLVHRGGWSHTLFYTGIGGNLAKSCANLTLESFDLEITSGQHLLRWYGIKNCTIGNPTTRSRLHYTSALHRGCINMKQGDGLLIQNVDQDGGGFGLGPLPQEDPAYRLTNVVVRNCTIRTHDFLQLEWGLVDAHFEDCKIITPQTPLTSTGPVAGRYAPTATFTRCRFYAAGKTQVYKGAVHGTYVNCTLNDRALGADGKIH